MKRELESRLYAGIDELPLLNFIDAVCDGRMDRLYKNGKPRKRDSLLIELVFSEMYAEYAERMLGDDRSVYEGMKRYALMAVKARILDASVLLVLNGTVDERTARILKRYGVRISGNMEKDLEMVKSARDASQRKLEELKSKMEEGSGEKENRDRKYYMALLASMGSHFKYGIPVKTTTVGEFCALYKQMWIEIRQMKKSLRKGHGRNY